MFLPYEWQSPGRGRRGFALSGAVEIRTQEIRSVRVRVIDRGGGVHETEDHEADRELGQDVGAFLLVQFTPVLQRQDRRHLAFHVLLRVRHVPHHQHVRRRGLQRVQFGFGLGHSSRS